MNLRKFFSSEIFPYLLLVVIWFVFSSPFFLNGKVPFPSTFQVNSFSPWSAYPELAGPVKNNAQPDIITQVYPWRHFSVDELKKGRIPLWNPYNFAGTPHVANYQSAAFFPLNILFFLPLTFIDAWSILVLLQPLLAAVGMYLFTRSLKISKEGSLVSSISFAFCGFITTWMGYAALGYAILFLPYALFAIQKYSEKRSFIYLPILAITIALSFLSGHFQTSAYFFLLVIAFGSFKLFPEYRNKKLISLPLFIVAGVLLAMPQILPTIELYMFSVRSELFQKMEAIPWTYLPTLFAPDFYGNPVTRNDWFGHYAEWNGYLGVVGLSLALLSLWKYKNKTILFFIVTAVVSLLLAFNTPLLSLLIALKIPVLSTSAAGRIIVLLSFSLAVLAGFGLDILVTYIQARQKIFFLWIGVLIVLFASMFGYAMLVITDPLKMHIARNNLLLPSFILMLFLGSSFLAYITKSKKILMALPIIAVIIVSADMMRFANKWQPFDPKEMVFKSVGVTEFYTKQNPEDRFIGDFGAENSVYYHLPVLGGYDPLYPEEYGRFVGYINNGKVITPERSAVVFPKNGKYSPEAIDFLGVKYIAEKVSDQNMPWGFPFASHPPEQFEKVYDDNAYRIFLNRDAFERAFIVFNTTLSNGEENVLKRMFSSDMSKTAVVVNDIKGLANGATGSAKIIEYLPNKVVIETSTTGKGLLVLTDNYYPGWRVAVNGKGDAIYKVDYNFRGVIVPKGDSTVIMEYKPQSFLIGIYLFMGGLLIMVTGFVLRRINKKS